jgi:hypothetical protein
VGTTKSASLTFVLNSVASMAMDMPCMVIVVFSGTPLAE